MQAAPATCTKVRRSTGLIPLDKVTDSNLEFRIIETPRDYSASPKIRPSFFIHKIDATLRDEPLVQTFANKLIVIEVRISCIHAVNLLFLPPG